MCGRHSRSTFFFFNDTATTEIYTLSLHDALPIFLFAGELRARAGLAPPPRRRPVPTEISRTDAVTRTLAHPAASDRKSTRLNSSHANISYAVFCLKKKKEYTYIARYTGKNRDGRV